MLKVLSLFSGVGGLCSPYKNVVMAIDSNPNTVETYRLNHPHVNVVCDDILTREKYPDHNFIVGGFNCQPYSISGLRKGFKDDRAKPLFKTIKLIDNPNVEGFCLENVKNFLSHNKGETFKWLMLTLQNLGFHVTYLCCNSKNHGVPQNRERVFIVGFRDPLRWFTFNSQLPKQKMPPLSSCIDFGEESEDSKDYFTPQQFTKYYELYKKAVNEYKGDYRNAIFQLGRLDVRTHKNGYAPCLTANMGGGGHNVPVIVTDAGNYRKLLPKETFNLQGFWGYKLPDIRKANLHQQAGNAVSLPLGKLLAKEVEKVFD
jgi:DNA (cytosine-5)-methyltransferase 1